jgi:hypothetical protein
MNNPFDLKNYKPQVCLKDVERSRRTSYQAMRVVNEKRKNGIEPCAPIAFGEIKHVISKPTDLALNVPKMETHEKRRNKK